MGVEVEIVGSDEDIISDDKSLNLMWLIKFSSWVKRSASGMKASAVGDRWDMLNINLKNDLSRFDQGFNNKKIKFSYLKSSNTYVVSTEFSIIFWKPKTC